MDDSDERVATYEYDALFRRIEKTVGNQGTGVVYGSDAGDITGIEAGNRHEHYFYTGWRLIETTNHAESGGDYSYSDADVLNQFVYGTQYIDEPLVYDRNEDPNEDDSCLDVDDGEAADGDSCRYFYHQDANFRVVALTDESAGVVERYRYTAYGEPTVYGGETASGDELHNAILVSSVGNPFMHQGLFRDRETKTYQNRFRQYDSKYGRFLQRDPAGYVDDMSLYGSYCGSPRTLLDALGLDPPEAGSSSEGSWLGGFDGLVNGLLGDWWGDNPDTPAPEVELPYEKIEAVATKIEQAEAAAVTTAKVAGAFTSAADFYELGTGETWLTGEEMDEWDYAFAGVGIVTLGRGDDAARAGRQVHHLLSKRILEAMGRVPDLRRLFPYKQFLRALASSYEAHHGYQHWHRLYDAQVAEWILRRGSVTAEEFLKYLIRVHIGADVKWRFPDAAKILEKLLKKLRCEAKHGKETL